MNQTNLNNSKNSLPSFTRYLHISLRKYLTMVLIFLSIVAGYLFPLYSVLIVFGRESVLLILIMMIIAAGIIYWSYKSSHWIWLSNDSYEYKIQQFIKRIIDISITISALIPLSPLMLLISVLIKLDSVGPIIIRHRVIGLHGHEFNQYKFRTLYIEPPTHLIEKNLNDESDIGSHARINNNIYVTRVGKWLRLFSLDELPQLINIVKGDMSLVGPRPISPTQVKSMSSTELERFSVSPGMTGLWQVKGFRGEKLNQYTLDVEYKRNWNIILDLNILLDTIIVVFRSYGAN